ncbi:vesicular inhibitory amino acid transporter-like [Montipora capricornis]|uniref:vesicular inhibitory amino acid transporter-like n=2 Tax=Montipora TaxID=46703 RepID=UPI0035F1ED80
MKTIVESDFTPSMDVKAGLKGNRRLIYKNSDLFLVTSEMKSILQQHVYGAYKFLRNVSDEESSEQEEVEKETHHAISSLEEEENKTTNLQTFWNIFNANQGVAILAMPYVVKSGGYMTLFSIVAIAFVSNFTNRILVQCLYEFDSDQTPFRVRNSYVEIGEAFSPKIGRHLVNAAQIFEQVSYCTLLLILCGSILASTFPFVPLYQSHWTALGAMLLLPNIFLKSLSEVSWVSFLTVMIGEIIYLTVTMYGMMHHERWNFASMPDFKLKTFGAAVGIIVVSYSSQPYMPAIEGSMKEPQKFGNVMSVTYVAVTFVKVAFGVIGFLTFTTDTDQVITNNLPDGGLHMCLNLLVLLLAATSYTIPVYTVFDILENIDFPFCKIDNPSDAVDRISYAQALAARLCIVSFTLFIGVLVPHFGLYMALVGSFTGMCLAFIFPAIFHMKICYDRLQWYDFVIDTSVALFGLVGAIIGCHFSVLALIAEYQKHEL